MVDTNGDHMLFQSLLLQQPFNNDKFLLKRVNLNNQINHFSQCTRFGTLCIMGNFLVHFKTKIYFSGWRDFMTQPMKYVLVLTLHWIISQNNMVTWYSDTVIDFWSFKQLVIVINQNNLGTLCSDTVTVFLGVSNDWAFSSPNKI